jgi:hypothetical protein
MEPFLEKGKRTKLIAGLEGDRIRTGPVNPENSPLLWFR